MPEDVTDDRPDGFSRPRQARRAGVELAPGVPGLARARMASSSPADRATTCGGPVRQASQRTPPDASPNQVTSPDGSTAAPQWAQASSAGISPSSRRHASSNRSILRVRSSGSPRCRKRDPRRVEQLRVRVVQVGQLVQQLGDVIAGIQGRQIAAKRCKALDRRRLGQEVQRLGRLGDQHDIGNPQQVKPTLQRRLRPPRPLASAADLPQLAGEERHHQAGLEDLDRPEDDGQGPTRRHARSSEVWGIQMEDPRYRIPDVHILATSGRRSSGNPDSFVTVARRPGVLDATHKFRTSARPPTQRARSGPTGPTVGRLMPGPIRNDRTSQNRAVSRE